MNKNSHHLLFSALWHHFEASVAVFNGEKHEGDVYLKQTGEQVVKLAGRDRRIRTP